MARPTLGPFRLPGEKNQLPGEYRAPTRVVGAYGSAAASQLWQGSHRKNVLKFGRGRRLLLLQLVCEGQLKACARYCD